MLNKDILFHFLDYDYTNYIQEQTPPSYKHVLFYGFDIANYKKYIDGQPITPELIKMLDGYVLARCHGNFPEFRSLFHFQPNDF